jgi:hypothetical protein
VKDIHFGFGKPFTDGTTPSVGLNRRGNVVVVHEAAGKTKHYRVGRLSHATINWGRSEPAGAGVTPRVALNNHDIAVEVHKNEGEKVLYCRAGKVHPTLDEVSWPNAERYAEGDQHARPVVAVNDMGVVVEAHEVHQGGIWIHCSVGEVIQTGNTFRVRWLGTRPHNQGSMPGIAINNHNRVVEVRRVNSGGTQFLWYAFGRVNGTAIDYTAPLQVIMLPGKPDYRAHGHYPSVALTDDGLVIVVLREQKKIQAFELIGRVSADGNRIDWNRWRSFDEGTQPAVAAAGTMAVEVHQHEDKSELRFSTSLITDRARWMQDRLTLLGPKRLRDLVLPASHDSGMYLGEGLATTQTLNIYQQLRYGIRYFDLRWEWVQDRWMVHHGIMLGPELQIILDDFAKFAREGHKELVILVFSSFKNGDHNDLYKIMVNQVNATIGDWLVKSRPPGQRLADATLNDYVKSVEKGPAILLGIHKRFAVDNPTKGFWVYRDWHQDEPGDLCVHDWYADKEAFDVMRDDQVGKFHQFKGVMKTKPKEPCDLFLLSWTLTPQNLASPTPWQLSRRSNPSLGQDVRLGDPPFRIPNAHGKIINMVYVDYVETSRATDVALFLNNAPVGAADDEKPQPRARTATRRRAKTTKRPPAKSKMQAKSKTRLRAKATKRPRAKAKTQRGAKAATRRRGK